MLQPAQRNASESLGVVASGGAVGFTAVIKVVTDSYVAINNRDKSAQTGWAKIAGVRRERPAFHLLFRKNGTQAHNDVVRITGTQEYACQTRNGGFTVNLHPHRQPQSHRAGI